MKIWVVYWPDKSYVFSSYWSAKNCVKCKAEKQDYQILYEMHEDGWHTYYLTKPHESVTVVTIQECELDPESWTLID
jgi:hypothetical protein